VAVDENTKKAAYALGYLLSMPAFARVQQTQLPVAEIARYSGQALLKLHTETLSALQRLAAQKTSGAISEQEFAKQVPDVLRPAYEKASLFGKYAAGRTRSLSTADMQEVDAQWQSEAKFVNDLARAAVSEAELNRRVPMYAHALREVFNRSWVHHKNSATYRWHMHPGAQHCIACVGANSGSGQGLPGGLYRLDELPFYPGRSPVCLDNCMCWLEASDGDVGAPQIREPAASGVNP
jgi:hypothetical protein